MKIFRTPIAVRISNIITKTNEVKKHLDEPKETFIKDSYHETKIIDDHFNGRNNQKQQTKKREVNQNSFGHAI